MPEESVSKMCPEKRHKKLGLQCQLSVEVFVVDRHIALPPLSLFYQSLPQKCCDSIPCQHIGAAQMAGRVGGVASGLNNKEKFSNVRALTSEEARLFSLLLPFKFVEHENLIFVSPSSTKLLQMISF